MTNFESYTYMAENFSSFALLIESMAIFILAISISSVLFYYYRRTAVLDYLLISGTFFFGAFANLFLYLIIDTNLSNPLLLMKANHWCLATVYLLFYIYSIRIRWEKLPRILASLGFIWYVLLVLLIAGYKVIPEMSTRDVLGIEMVHLGNLPLEVGISWNNVFIMGGGYHFLLLLFRILAFTLILVFYLTTDFALKSRKIKILHIIWVIAISMYITPPLLELGHLLSLWNIQNLTSVSQAIVLLSILLVIYITVINSEAILLTHIQLLRAAKLYTTIEALETYEDVKKFGMNSLVRYMKSIPPDLMKSILTKEYD